MRVQVRFFKGSFFKGLLALFFFLWMSSVSAKTEKDSLVAGIFIDKIHAIDYKEGYFSASFRIWVISSSQPYDLQNFINIKNARNTILSDYRKNENFSFGRNDIRTLSEIKVYTEISQNFNVQDYPFDKEKLIVEVELTKGDAYNQTLILDNLKEIIKPQSLPNDWKVKSQKVLKSNQEKQGTKGFSQNGGSMHNGIKASISVDRGTVWMFVKLFSALIISFLIAAISIFIPNHKYEPKFSLILGGLFGVIGNKYITDDLLPEVSELHLSDKLHLTTILYLLVITIITVVRACKPDEYESPIKKDFLLFGYCVLSYCMICLYFVFG